MGDSIAVSYLPGLRAALEPLGWDFQLLTMHICNNATSVLLDNKAYTACDRRRSWATRKIQELKPDLVVLANVTAIDDVDPRALHGTRLQTWRSGLAATIRLLRSASPHIVVLSPPPGGQKLSLCVTRHSSPRDCVSRSPTHGTG